MEALIKAIDRLAFVHLLDANKDFVDRRATETAKQVGRLTVEGMSRSTLTVNGA